MYNLHYGDLWLCEQIYVPQMSTELKHRQIHTFMEKNRSFYLRAL